MPSPSTELHPSQSRPRDRTRLHILHTHNLAALLHPIHSHHPLYPISLNSLFTAVAYCRPSRLALTSVAPPPSLARHGLDTHLPQVTPQGSSGSTSKPSSASSSMSGASSRDLPLLTPITTMSESSPLDRPPSPLLKKRTHSEMLSNGLTSTALDPQPSRHIAALTPNQTPPEPPSQARPPKGQPTGQKTIVVVDPDAAPSTDGHPRRKYKSIPFGLGKEVRAASSQVFWLTLKFI